MGENISTRVAYGKALAEFGTDEKLFVFDADLKKCTMTLYFAEKYPERFFNIGIAEANMVDIAAGFATCGATALVHTFAIFATGRTYDQIRNSVCYPRLNVKIVDGLAEAGLLIGDIHIVIDVGVIGRKMAPGNAKGRTAMANGHLHQSDHSSCLRNL